MQIAISNLEDNLVTALLACERQCGRPVGMSYTTFDVVETTTFER